MGELQWDHLDGFQLMKNDRNQVPLPPHAVSQPAQRTCVKYICSCDLLRR
jgi:hypothetical protein